MKILVVDDEPMQRDMLKGFLEKQGYAVAAAANGRDALKRFAEQPFQLVLLDHRMPDMNGDEVLAEIRKADPRVRAIMITAFSSVDTAVAVMKLGADDFLEKPIDLVQLLEKIRTIEQALLVADEAADVTDALDQSDLPVRLIGSSTAMKEVLSLVRRVAPTPWTVLVRGETGTGKELVARLIHLLSVSKDGPFIEVNCSAIPENLFESELFGHEKGAFTGASASRRGRFEMADGGSLFLDEIGELPMALQPKLLRALQENRVRRVGGEKEITVNARVITATNRDLGERTTEGHFREDLYYRLKVLDIELPPLRQRREDISDLVDFFLDRYSLRPTTIDPEAMAILVKYDYPGNVRELENVIQRTVTLARGAVIRPEDLPPELRHPRESTAGNLAERLESVEKRMILAALEKENGVQTRAAEALGISERVLRYKMQKYGIKKR
ncbi:MAG: sigma-54-dependent Fis family transcriptional regulator [Desulfobacterales bacterium]|nr:sigma-54-dependent Fis family transcriptional regulator [Desulfobacterales bacterium]